MSTIVEQASRNRHDPNLPWVLAQKAVTQADLIRRREISCVELVNLYLDHIERVNGQFNAIVALQERAELQAVARTRDDALARGDSVGSLHGLPIAVKDLSATRGIVTTMGSRIFRTNVPAQDSIGVERLRSAGAIVIGKTNTPEFGLGSQTYNDVYGATLNPYDPSRTSGGSSGGAAAALALRMLPLADGSDFGGSLRNPAAFCNVLGLRPSAGCVPAGPALDVFMQQLGTEGPLARCADDLALLLSVQAGRDRRVPLSYETDQAQWKLPDSTDLRGQRIGWLGDWDGYLPMEPGIVELCRGGLTVLAGMGCTVESHSMTFDPQRLWKIWLAHRHGLVGSRLLGYYMNEQSRPLLKPEAQWEVEGLLRMSAAEVYAASEDRSAWYAHALTLFDQFDFLAVPTAQVFPFDVELTWPRQIAGVAMDTYHRWMEVVFPWTLCGFPVLNVPVGFHEGGLPMGMQIIGAPRAERKLLELAKNYEASADWVHTKLPPVLSR